MKNLFMFGILILSSIAYSSDDYGTCTEVIEVVSDQIQSIKKEQKQRYQEKLCSEQYNPTCNIDLEVYTKVIQNLKQTIKKIQQYCSKKYVHQQQQQYPPQQQQLPRYLQQREITEDQILNTGFNIILFCEGTRNDELKFNIDRGDCLLPNGEWYKQPQDGTICSHRAIYLKNNDAFAIGQASYTCK